MNNLLGHHLNKCVSVSIPAIFNDDVAHLCILGGIETAGVWLSGEEIGDALFAGREDRASKNVFVPFPQVRYLTEPIAKQASPRPQKAAEQPKKKR